MAQAVGLLAAVVIGVPLLLVTVALLLVTLACILGPSSRTGTLIPVMRQLVEALRAIRGRAQTAEERPGPGPEANQKGPESVPDRVSRGRRAAWRRRRRGRNI
jgi:hypothetical protein